MDQAVEDNKPESPADLMRRVLGTVQNTKAWALAKADTVERRIAEAGGEPAPDLKQALAELRAAAS
jgi:hypothetical protein